MRNARRVSAASRVSRPPSPSRAGSVTSPIVSIDRIGGDVGDQVESHSHPEPILMLSSTATGVVNSQTRDWIVPPGYGVWVPGSVEHAGSLLRAGEGSIVAFAPDRCPITWTETTGVEVGPLLREIVTHLQQIEPDHPSRPHAEALVFELLTPVPANDLQVSMPDDPRVRTIAERLIADPADPRELAAWADHVHAGVRTLSRLFVRETGLSFARWRTQVRMSAAIHLLAEGTPVGAVARAVGYRETSAFIAAFRRTTGHTPGTYVPTEGAPATRWVGTASSVGVSGPEIGRDSETVDLLPI